MQRAVEEVRTIHRFKKAQVLGDRPLVIVKLDGMGTPSTLGSPWLTGSRVLGKDCSMLTCLVLQFSLVPVLHGCGQSCCGCCNPLPSPDT